MIGLPMDGSAAFAFGEAEEVLAWRGRNELAEVLVFDSFEELVDYRARQAKAEIRVMASAAALELAAAFERLDLCIAFQRLMARRDPTVWRNTPWSLTSPST